MLRREGWDDRSQPSQEAEQWWRGCHSCSGRAEVKSGCRVGAWANLGGQINSGMGNVTCTSCGSASGLKGILSAGSEDLAYKVLLVWLPWLVVAAVIQSWEGMKMLR